MSFVREIDKTSLVPKGADPIFLSHPDEPNLKIRIGDTSKSWVFRYRRKKKVIGHYPKMSVTSAKDEVRRLKDDYASNQDAEIDREFKLQKSAGRTFQKLAEQINDTYPSPTLKTRYKYSKAAFKTFWDMPISQISKHLVM